MAETRRVPIYGSRPPCAYQPRPGEHGLRSRNARLEPDGFVRYEDSDEEVGSTMSLCTSRLNTSYNFVDYIRSREYGMREYRSVNVNYPTRHILTHHLFRQRSIQLAATDKVFCSQWLSGELIIFGTKCNRLMVYNVQSHELDEIPLIKGRANDAENQQNSIRSLKMNPSRTLLATSAYNSNEIAVYRLPTLDKFVLAEGAHNDLIFDIEWLDDEFFVSGSRDNKFVLWKVQDKYQEKCDSDCDLIQPVAQFIIPAVITNTFIAEKVGAISFYKNLKTMLTLSPNGYVHVWDVESFRPSFSRRVACPGRCLSMAMQNSTGLCAVGCCSDILILDSRTLHTIRQISSKYTKSVIRSLSFQDNIITIGTGIGVIKFYDVRAGKYLKSSIKHSESVLLNTSRDYVGEDFIVDHNVINMPAIYTHCYDYSGTRLFAAGGPLPCNLFNNYACLWQ